MPRGGERIGDRRRARVAQRASRFGVRSAVRQWIMRADQTSTPAILRKCRIAGWKWMPIRRRSARNRSRHTVVNAGPRVCVRNQERPIPIELLGGRTMTNYDEPTNDCVVKRRDIRPIDTAGGGSLLRPCATQSRHALCQLDRPRPRSLQTRRASTATMRWGPSQRIKYGTGEFRPSLRVHENLEYLQTGVRRCAT
jgi:hypothetical protein